jgi:methylmalonyl-CoA mutase C-terminal domain/subunit
MATIVAQKSLPGHCAMLKEKNMDDVLIVGGGIIPEEDVPALKKAGIAAVFGPGTPVEDIVTYIQKNVKR